MDTQQTASDPRAVAKAVFLDGVARRLSVEDACAAAGFSRRSLYNWRESDPEFAAAWDATVEDAAHVVNRTRMAEWAAALAKHDAELAQIAAELHEIAALALAGDAAAQARQAELQARRAQVEEAVSTLRTAIASGEAHLQRQAEAKAQADRDAAAAEDQQLAQEQQAAAAEVDAALATLEQATQRFQDAAIKRQSAQHRATGNPRRVVADRQIMQALFAGAPRFAVLIRADRKLAGPHARPLSELLQ